MNKYLSLLLIGLMFSFTSVNAQTSAIDAEFKTATISQLGELVVENYVSEEVAVETYDHLKVLLKKGHFDKIDELEPFAEALTEAVQSINHDKHMRIKPLKKKGSHAEKEVTLADKYTYKLTGNRADLYGFMAAKKLEGNIGYLDLRGFADVSIAAHIADNYMALLSSSDAIIIDLRKNGGGHPAMVQYLCSYFFADKVHLNSLYYREGDQTKEFWTIDVKGEKMEDTPLYILTSNKTFSGAEEFSYNMQTQKRATLVGEVTGGGANPGGNVKINDQLMVFIPTGKAINPITGTNWEGVGVKPHIETTADEAFDKAYELAKETVDKHRQVKLNTAKNLLNNLEHELASLNSNSSQKVHKYLSSAIASHLLGEGEINMMGYEFLGKNQLNQAEAIFESNTKLFPNSANVYDSYAEALGLNSKTEQSIINYKKAVDTARKNENPQLEIFEANLRKATQKSHHDHGHK